MCIALSLSLSLSLPGLFITEEISLDDKAARRIIRRLCWRRVVICFVYATRARSVYDTPDARCVYFPIEIVIYILRRVNVMEIMDAPDSAYRC